MTVSSQLNRIAYDGTGALTPLAVSFPFPATTDLVVVETIILTGVSTTLTITTDYEVTGTPDDLGNYSEGGTVTPVLSFATTVRWTIYRDPLSEQGLDLTNNDNFPSESVEAQFDYLTMLIQRVSDLITRSLRQPDGDSANIAVLPTLVDRLGKFLYFDATTGDPLAVEASDGTLAVLPLDWVPEVGGTATYTNQEGSSVKIGRLVFIRCALTINVIGTGSTTEISELPYPPQLATPLSVSFSDNLATAVTSISAITSGSAIEFRSRTAANADEALNAIFGNGTILFVSGCYHTAA